MKPQITAFLLAVLTIAILAESATPAMAWWQFVSLDAQGGRKASIRFNTEEECKAALKATAIQLKTAFPNRFPLVGSCEEYQ